jgi:hypothetical protein
VALGVEVGTEAQVNAWQGFGTSEGMS